MNCYINCKTYFVRISYDKVMYHILNRVGPDIRFGRIPDIEILSGYPVLSDIQPYFTEVIPY